ncbi:MAG: S9 family peptidase [Planctomycetales bacterium]|nr:S9 family peptidase [Planctomycetales bacterium]
MTKYLGISILGTSTYDAMLRVMLVLSLWATAHNCPADDMAGIQARHVAKLQFVTSVVASPDARHFAYILSVPREPLGDADGPAWSELHVLDRDGKSRPFVTGKVNVDDISWSADGRYVYYRAKRNDDTKTSLYRIPIDGGESQQIATAATDIAGYSLIGNGQDPDHDLLAYVAKEDQPKQKQEVRDKGFDQEVYEEDWQPARIWLTTAGANDEPRMLDLPGSVVSVAWSPSATELAVVMAPTSLVDDFYMNKKLYIVDAASGSITQTIDNPGKLGDVAWSPNGKYLAMISAADRNDPHEGRLMVVGTAGQTELRDLLPDLQAHVSSIAWKDNDTIVWVADEGTSSRVGSVTIAGQSQTLVEPGGEVLGGISLSKDGRTAGLVGHTPRHPHEVFTLRGDGKPTRISHHNAWLESMPLAKQETITWKAKDGLELQGVLVYPLHYVAGRRYPLIMLVHGGPESHESDGWMTSYSRPGQLGAARGFMVFYINYRGSTGRGVAFSKLGQADAAGKEFDDLIDGIDHLVDAGLVDRDRVGITGGSYGGYASAWGATYFSDRFAASVMFVGISDAISKMGTTDIPEEMYLVHHRKRLWEDWSYFAERSPIRHVQRNRTPTLILHGKNDPRVHPSQSLELHRHLKTLGQAPVRLVLYEGEGHGNRKAAARLDYNLRLMQWMEHYLQGPGGTAPPAELDYDAALK